jgi:hypothetical protein
VGTCELGEVSKREMTRRSLFKKSAAAFVGGLAMRFLPVEVAVTKIPVTYGGGTLTMEKLKGAYKIFAEADLTTQYAKDWEAIMNEKILASLHQQGKI